MKKFALICAVTAITLSLALIGCGGKSDEDGETVRDEIETPDAVPFPTEDATIAVAGIVKFEGDVPVRKQLVVSGSDAVCTAAHGANPILSEVYVVDDHGDHKTLTDVYVRVKGLEKTYKGFTTPSTAVVINQKGCQYKPHAAALMTGQELKVTSDDDTTHNVHYVGNNPEKNKTSKLGQVISWKFNKADVKGKLKCDVHSWMGAQLYIQSHPFHAVTGSEGTFSLGMLPPGTYTIEARHAKAGRQSQTITLEKGKPAPKIEFVFKKK